MQANQTVKTAEAARDLAEKGFNEYSEGVMAGVSLAQDGVNAAGKFGAKAADAVKENIVVKPAQFAVDASSTIAHIGQEGVHQISKTGQAAVSTISHTGQAAIHTIFGGGSGVMHGISSGGKAIGHTATNIGHSAGK